MNKMAQNNIRRYGVPKYTNARVHKPQTRVYPNSIGDLLKSAEHTDNAEIEYRLVERPLGAGSGDKSVGVHKSTFQKLAFLKLDYDESFITSDSLIYIGKDGARHMFIDNGERLTIQTQTKTTISTVHMNDATIPLGDTNLSVKLVLSSEITKDYRSETKRPDNMETVISDMYSCHKHIAAELESARILPRRVLVCGGATAYGGAPPHAPQSRGGAVETVYVDFRSSFEHAESVGGSVGCSDIYVCIEDLMNGRGDLTGWMFDAVIDYGFITNYCNRDSQYIARIYQWISSHMNPGALFCSMRVSNEYDAHYIVSNLRPETKFLYSKLYINAAQYRLYMYKYRLAQYSSVSFGTMIVEFFRRCDAKSMLANIHPLDLDYFVRRKTTYTFIKDLFFIELSTIHAASPMLSSFITTDTIKSPVYEVEMEFTTRPTLQTVYEPLRFIREYICGWEWRAAPAPHHTPTLGRLTPPSTNDVWRNMMNVVSGVIKYENKPINITKDNMVGINFERYACTNKANGVRFYLIDGIDSQLYLVNGSEQFCIGRRRFIPSSPRAPPPNCSRAIVPSWGGVGGRPARSAEAPPRWLLDGELVGDVYHVIDCVCSDFVAIPHKSLKERQDEAARFISIARDNSTFVFEKSAPKTFQQKVYYYSGEFYKRVISACEQMKRGCALENDGLIFTSMGDYRDKIYKFKYDISHITIDFYVDEHMVCNVYDNDKAQFEPYHFNDPFGQKTRARAISHFNDIEYVKNMVCECMYDPFENAFEITRIRGDKKRPNHKYVANNIWCQISNMMSLSDFVERIVPKDAKSHAALRFYHNLVKRDLITQYANGVILDLGSGVGGDITKYVSTGRAKTIYLCEPDAAKIEEMKARINGLGISSKIEIHNKRAQDVRVCVNAADTIGAFFMLSFFYETENELNALVETVCLNLKCGGYFIGTMIDNHDMKDYDSEYGGITIKKIARTEPGPGIYGIKTEIKFKDCLNQYEYESSFDALKYKLEARGVYLVNTARFGARDYLTDDENDFSALYRSFVFIKQSSPIVRHFVMSGASIDTVVYNDIKTIAKHIVIKYGDNLGIDRYTMRRIVSRDYKLYEIMKIPSINQAALSSNILAIYKDLLRTNELFAAQHWCIVNHKNAHVLLNGHTRINIYICSVYKWADEILNLCATGDIPSPYLYYLSV